jgi:hypothetical protein
LNARSRRWRVAPAGFFSFIVESFLSLNAVSVKSGQPHPIVSDNGTVEGHLGLHGFTFVFYPFLPETDDPRLIRTRDVRWFPPGLVLAEPWDGNSVYLFGFSDTPEIRARVESSDSIATLLSLTELVFELEIER